MKLLLGSLVAEVNGIDFPLVERQTNLERFVTDGAADFVVDAVVGKVPRSEWRRAEWFPGQWDKARRQVTFRRTGCSAVVDLDARHVRMTLGGPWALAVDYLLAPAIQVLAPELRRGAMFHASSAVADELAAVFLGRSGAGKTTAGALARQAGAELISEEITYVALEPQGARLCALPFRQKYKLATPGPGAYPLPAFYALQQSDKDAIEPIPSKEWFKQLLARAVVGLRDRTFSVPVLEMCEALAERVPVRRLSFLNTPAFWQLVEEDMRARVTP